MLIQIAASRTNPYTSIALYTAVAFYTFVAAFYTAVAFYTCLLAAAIAFVKKNLNSK